MPWAAEWQNAHADSGEELRRRVGRVRRAVARGRARSSSAAATAALGATHPAWGGRAHPSLRWVLVHMIEEYARHNGHADLLRQAIDGETGE